MSVCLLSSESLCSILISEMSMRHVVNMCNLSRIQWVFIGSSNANWSMLIWEHDVILEFETACSESLCLIPNIHANWSSRLSMSHIVIVDMRTWGNTRIQWVFICSTSNQRLPRERELHASSLCLDLRNDFSSSGSETFDRVVLWSHAGLLCLVLFFFKS